MTSRAKVLLSVILTAVLCLGAPVWWRKLMPRFEVNFKKHEVQPAPVLELEPRVVFWQNGEVQTNFCPSGVLPAQGDKWLMGFQDDGHLVWKVVK